MCARWIRDDLPSHRVSSLELAAAVMHDDPEGVVASIKTQATMGCNPFAVAARNPCESGPPPKSGPTRKNAGTAREAPGRRGSSGHLEPGSQTPDMRLQSDRLRSSWSTAFNRGR